MQPNAEPILVGENEPQTLAQIKSAFEGTVYELILAPSDLAVINILSSQTILLLVLNLALVQGDPHRFFEEIRQISPLTTIIGYTHDLNHFQNKRLIRAGMNLLLEKHPVQFENLPEYATYILEHAQLWRENQNYQETLKMMKVKQKEELALHDTVLNRERIFNDSIISSIISGLVVIDNLENIIVLNETARKIFKIKSPDFLGAHYASVLPEKFCMSLQQSERKLSQPGEVVFQELIELDESQFVSYVFNQVLDPQGVVIGKMIVANDVTKQKMMEEQLFQSEKLATLGTMISGIAHELRNPLAIISARAQRLLSRREELDEKTAKGIESMETQSVRCGEIVNNLLNLARKKEVQTTLCSINDIINDSLNYVQMQTNFSQITVDKNFDQRSLVRCDRSQMEQVFLNLFSNAIDAMNGSGTLRLETMREGGQLKIFVQDSGAGMSDETKRKLFDPFYTTKDAGKGVGLGLTIVYRIIERHRGTISVESLPGRTVFNIALPCEVI